MGDKLIDNFQNIASSIVAVAGTMVSYLFGYTEVLELLFVFVVLDYVTAIMAACYHPKLKLDTRKGTKGIIKKVMIFLVVSLAHFLDRALGQDFICTMVALFFLSNEGLSILGNAAKIGLPLPERFISSLEQMRQTNGGELEEKRGKKK